MPTLHLLKRGLEQVLLVPLFALSLCYRLDVRKDLLQLVLNALNIGTTGKWLLVNSSLLGLLVVQVHLAFDQMLADRSGLGRGHLKLAA